MALGIAAQPLSSPAEQRHRPVGVVPLDVHRGHGHLDHPLPEVRVLRGGGVPDLLEALMGLEVALLAPQPDTELQRLLDRCRVVLLGEQVLSGVVGQRAAGAVTRSGLLGAPIVTSVTACPSGVPSCGTITLVRRGCLAHTDLRHADVLAVDTDTRHLTPASVTVAGARLAGVPELPEVESVRRQLAPELTGRRVTAVWWDPHPHTRLSDLDLMVDRRVDTVRRRGKYLLCPLDPTVDGDRLELILHLGMTGSLAFWPTTHPGTGSADDGLDRARHVRVRFELDDGRALHFRDPRRFGRASVVPAGDYAGRIPTLASLGPEPLSGDFDAERFAAALAATTAPVKAKLLDQRLVAGVGNIYADEALWRARIHPASRRVGHARALRLHSRLVEVLTAAVEREGTSFRDYQMVNGQSGRYADHLNAYGQADLPCRRCGHPMRRAVIAQRGTTYCPTCQR